MLQRLQHVYMHGSLEHRLTIRNFLRSPFLRYSNTIQGDCMSRERGHHMTLIQLHVHVHVSYNNTNSSHLGYTVNYVVKTLHYHISGYTITYVNKMQDLN